MNDTKIAVLVIGNARGGTSMISHVISELGFCFGDPTRFVDTAKYNWNPIFFELQSLNHLNDEICQSLGATYFDDDLFPLKEDFNVNLIFMFEEKVRSFLQNEFGSQNCIGLKDPRFTITLPIWTSLLKRFGYSVRFVWVVRDLSKCVLSNKAINDSDPMQTERLVARSSYLAAYFLDGEKYFFANYDEFVDNPHNNVLDLANWLGVSVASVEKACKVIQPALRHQVMSKNLLSHELNALSELLMSNRLKAEHYLKFRNHFFVQGLMSLLQERNKQLSKKNEEILHYVNSKSWRITRPFRKILRFIRERKK